jgi:alpha-beta hydrolase superfamily lysophospholipase
VRRWRNRVVAVVGGFVVASLTVIPFTSAIWDTHKPRGDVGAPPSAAWRSVAFDSTDGLRLRGWLRPSRNGATVLVIHGGGGDRTGAMRHARMLERNGFGVLVYDARGRGESQGQPNSWGWDWEKDALGAMRFLRARGDVDAGRIAALGLSSGGDTVLDLAARDHRLRAVVADGAALRTDEDARRQFGTSIAMLPSIIGIKAVGLWSGQSPSRPLEDLVRDIRSPTLLISAGTDAERDFDRSYTAAAPDYLTHWNLPHARHTGALRRYPVPYEHRVVGFLRRALAG